MNENLPRPRPVSRRTLMRQSVGGAARVWTAVFTASSCLIRPAHAQSTPASAAPQDEDWLDGRRQRRVPVRVRWPQGGGAPTHLLLFSHGLGGTRAGGAVWAQAWADAGFAVVQMQHPGSDLDAVRAAVVGRGQGALQQVGGPRQLLDRLEDVRFVLDEAHRRQREGEGRWRDLVPQRVGLAGHSFGAHTTLGMAGQRYPVGSAVDEPRLAAFIAFSPTIPARGDAQAAFAGITRPLLALTGTEDNDVVGNGATPDRRRAVYAALPPGQRAQLVLDGADHMSFSGQDLPPIARLPRHPTAAAREPAHRQLLAALTTDWWRAQLLGDAAARERLRQPVGLGPVDEWQIG